LRGPLRLSRSRARALLCGRRPVLLTFFLFACGRRRLRELGSIGLRMRGHRERSAGDEGGARQQQRLGHLHREQLQAEKRRTPNRQTGSGGCMSGTGTRQVRG
jgi:hypothetical protein